MKKTNMFWGLFFILAAVLVLVGNLGFLEGVHMFSLFITIILVALLIKSIRYVEFGGILFSLAFLAIIYDEQLGIEALTPWPVLGAALFGSIGLSMIVPSRHRYSHHTHTEEYNEYHNDEHFDRVETDNADIVNVYASFGAIAKYVKSDNFVKANVECKFGAAKVYFDDTQIPQKNATINLHVSFAGVELYVPKNWKIVFQTSSSFGAVEEKNKAVVTEDSPVVTITGDSNFAGVEIIYV